jgi:hypothetical protein
LNPKDHLECSLGAKRIRLWSFIVDDLNRVIYSHHSIFVMVEFFIISFGADDFYLLSIVAHFD